MSDLAAIEAALAAAYASSAEQQQWGLAHPGYGMPLPSADDPGYLPGGAPVITGSGEAMQDQSGAAITDQAGDALS